MREGAQTTGAKRDTEARADEAAYNLEHSLAYLMALAALVLGVIGALAAFDVIDLRSGSVAGVVDGDANAIRDFQDGVLLLIPGIACGLLALGLHMNDHHLTGGRSNASMFNAEHGGAYLLAVLALATVLLDIVVGFDIFDGGNTWRDGVTWGLLAIIFGGMSATLHAVRHHAEAENINVIIEDRVGRAIRDAGGMRPEPGIERR
jgi:hypothetical protein